MKKKHIMIIDPDKDRAAVFKECLKKDYLLTLSRDCLQPSNGSIPPDLIFLNPGTGHETSECCKGLKSHEGTKNVPIIVLIDPGTPEEKQAAFDAGAADVIQPPAVPREIRAKADIHGELSDLKERLKVLIEHLPIGIIRSTPEGRILDMNPEMMNIFGISSREKVKDRSILDFYFDIKDRPVLLERIHQSRVRDFPIRFKKSDGSLIWCSISVSPQESAREGKYYISSVQDITEKIKIQEEKAGLLIKLTQTDKMASIGQLAAGVAHEINNPVGFVNSNINSLGQYLVDLKTLIQMNHCLTEALPDSHLSPEILKLKQEIQDFSRSIETDFLMKDIDELLADCREGLERIKKIVIDLKDFAHPGKKDPERVNVNTGIESTLNVVANELKYKARVHRDLGEVPLILAVPQQINQVFLNILVNAAQSMEETGDITIRTRRDEQDVVIEISDTGCGIPPENLTKIFDPFFTTKEIGKGTGLGMHIVYNIVRHHRGTLEVESEVGQGTCFRIRFPAIEDRE